MSQRARFTLRRIYDDPERADGFRVLVDRLWPRGVSKERAHLDLWAKEVAPTPELRRWYAHDDQRFDQFERRYLEELASPAASAVATELLERSMSGTVTLLTANRDLERSSAGVLYRYLVAARPPRPDRMSEVRRPTQGA